jgi:hypothetical protein
MYKLSPFKNFLFSNERIVLDCILHYSDMACNRTELKVTIFFANISVKIVIYILKHLVMNLAGTV